MLSVSITVPAPYSKASRFEHFAGAACGYGKTGDAFAVSK